MQNYKLATTLHEIYVMTPTSRNIYNKFLGAAMTMLFMPSIWDSEKTHNRVTIMMAERMVPAEGKIVARFV